MKEAVISVLKIGITLLVGHLEVNFGTSIFLSSNRHEFC